MVVKVLKKDSRADLGFSEREAKPSNESLKQEPSWGAAAP